MLSKETIIEAKNNTSLFQEFIKNSTKSPSPKAQQNFLNIITNVADIIKKICISEKLIFDVKYDGKKYWEQGKKYQACFIDGGVYSSFLSSSAPFAIRAKSYIVKPDEALHKREVFEETVKFVGDLYDTDTNLYDLSEDPYEDNQLLTKKKDAARITFEAAAIVRHIFDKQNFEYCFLHGPLQTPIMPFSGPEFPLFKKNVIKNILPFFKINESSELDRHFINIYLNSINYIKKSKFPIFGIVERTGSTIYIRNLLFVAQRKGLISEADYDKTIGLIKRYKINDGNLFELILKDCQALKPLEVEKQIPSKAWGEWQNQMDNFPKVFISYLRTNKHQAPIRIESLMYPKNLTKDFEYILATSKLLPGYGFPAGLDVVDKAAKIPAWLGRTARGYYLKYYLNLALKSKDPSTITTALKTISNGGRQWKNRPKAGGLPR